MKLKLRKKHGIAAILITLGFIMLPIPPEGPDVALVMILSRFVGGLINSAAIASLLAITLIGLGILILKVRR